VSGPPPAAQLMMTSKPSATPLTWKDGQTRPHAAVPARLLIRMKAEG
jgi:hypothetical protein